jgi:hypothetical protein
MNGCAARPVPTIEHLRRTPRLVALVAAAFTATTAGCLSNEYRIPHDELVRIAQLAPETRGERVRVVQELGRDRDLPGVDRSIASEPPADSYIETQTRFELDARGDLRPVATQTRVRGGPWRNPSAVPASSEGSHGGGWRGGGGGGGNLNLGGGGGGKGEEVLILAVLVAAVAAVAVIGLAASEGARFDGHVAIAPQQPLHLKNDLGQELHVAMGALTLDEALGASEAVVLEDEGPGLHRRQRNPLDRVGCTFKVTMGSVLEPPPARAAQPAWSSGFGSTIQLGGFFTRSMGLLASVNLGMGNDAQGRTFQRHGLGLETQLFPLRAGPLSVGAFAHAGLQIAGNSDQGLDTGPALGGGVMVEVALSTRLALALRGDWTAARIESHQDGWTGHGSVTAGLAIY